MRPECNATPITAVAGGIGLTHACAHVAEGARVLADIDLELSLMQSAELDRIRHGIHLSAISPGLVDHENRKGFPAKRENKASSQEKAEAAAAVPFRRTGVAEDLSGIATCRASGEASYILVRAHTVDGGQGTS